MPNREELLSQTIEHIDITRTNVVPLVDAMRHMAFTARDLHRAADIYDRGVILTGGGALLDGIDQYIRSFINLPVGIAEEPRYATVNGLVKMFDDPKLLERVSRNELGVLQNAEIPFEA